MSKFLFVLFLFIVCHLHAQVVPAEGSRLNYRIIGFSPSKFKPDIKFSKCKVEIAKGTYYNERSFKQHIIDSPKLNRYCRVIFEVPDFGQDYTWRVVLRGKDKDERKNEFYHFSTLPYPDDIVKQLRVISSNTPPGRYFVFVDAANTLYDMQGKPVWFVPGNDMSPVVKTGMRDLKMSPYGTVTYLMEDKAMEIDYNGKIRWHAPNTGAVAHDTSEHYHHEFTRLANGHYMVLGTEPVKAKLLSFRGDSSGVSKTGKIVKDSLGAYWQKLEFGTLIEYDTAGNVVWAWKSFDYFSHSEIFSHYLPDGSFPNVDVHENAFYFNENDSVVYIGFRDVSRIIKLKYPGRNVLAAYGTAWRLDSLNCNNFFCGQHSISLTSNGDLCLYNNNSFNNSSLPKVEVIRESPDNQSLGLVWEYDCNLDSLNEDELRAYTQGRAWMQALNVQGSRSAITQPQTSGGFATQLPDLNFFVSMGGQDCKMSVVNKTKKVLWSAIPEMKMYKGSPWTPFASYRAHIITHDELRALIWSAK